MTAYLQYFALDGAHALGFVAVLATWMALGGLGALVLGRERLAAGDVLYGWAMALIVVTAIGAFTTVPFTIPGFVILITGVVSLGLVWRRDGRILAPGLGKTLILATPLFVMVAAMAASQWDEFSHWLPSARYLIEVDRFPDAASPQTGASFPAYPYGWPFITYLASLLTGGLIENAGAIFNILLLAGFGVAAAGLALNAADRDVPSRWGWGLAALGLLAGTLLNPTFVQKVVLTAYADVPAAVALGFGAILADSMLEALARGRRDEARRYAWQFGLAMVVLVNAKQATLVLAVVLFAGVVIAAWRDPEIELKDILRLSPAMIVPGAVIYGLWRYYVATELAGREFTILPFDKWNLHLIHQIVWQMAVVASKKGLYFGLMLVAVGFAIKGFFRPGGRFERVALIVAVAFLGYNGFLLFTYVAAFGEFDALRVGSYWRYNLHLGLLAVVFAAFGLGRLWRRYRSADLVPTAAAAIAVAIVVIAPLALAKRVRFDLEDPKPHYRAVARSMVTVLPVGSRVLLLDPTGTGESAVITRFDLGRARGAEQVNHIAAFHDFSAGAVRRELLPERRISHILVHSLSPVIAEVLGIELAPGASYLIQRLPEGGWRVVHSWPIA